MLNNNLMNPPIKRNLIYPKQLSLKKDSYNYEKTNNFLTHSK